VREKKPREEWIRIENAHEAIISRADFEIISDIIQKDTRVTAGKRAVSIYSGYLVCADCGCSMVRKKAYSGSFEYVYYVCSGNKKNKDTCSSHRISENALNLAVTKTLQLHLKHLADVQESILYIRKKSCNSDKIKMMVLQSEKIKGDIEKYNRLKLECYEDYKNELITQDEYLLFKKELDNRIEDTKKAATELSKKKRMLLDGRYEKESFMEKFLTSKDIELKRSLFVRFISQICV
jgi:site-specific DNA recombinase